MTKNTNTNLGTVQWAQPSETTPNPENCKNCLSACAYDSSQYSHPSCHYHITFNTTLWSIQNVTLSVFK